MCSSVQAPDRGGALATLKSGQLDHDLGPIEGRRIERVTGQLLEKALAGGAFQDRRTADLTETDAIQK